MKYFKDKFSEVPIHRKLKNIGFNRFGMYFDGTNLNPCAMWDEKSVYPKTVTGFPFKLNMNDIYMEAFNKQNSIRSGNESAIKKIFITLNT